MKHAISLIAALVLCASAYGQTVRTLAYNISNNVVIGATNTNALTWSNSFAWSTNTLAGATRTNLSLGWTALTNTNGATSLLGFTTNGQVVANTGTNFLTFTNHVAFSASDITTYGGGLSAFGVSLNFEERRVQDASIANDIFNWDSGEYVELGLPLAFVSSTNAATTRANLGLPLAALTNTSNVTAMRALAGSTNTNEPYSGTISLTNTNTLTFSNGVLLKIQ